MVVRKGLGREGEGRMKRRGKKDGGEDEEGERRVKGRLKGERGMTGCREWAKGGNEESRGTLEKVNGR